MILTAGRWKLLTTIVLGTRAFSADRTPERSAPIIHREVKGMALTALVSRAWLDRRENGLVVDLVRVEGFSGNRYKLSVFAVLNVGRAQSIELASWDDIIVNSTRGAIAPTTNPNALSEALAAARSVNPVQAPMGSLDAPAIVSARTVATSIPTEGGDENPVDPVSFIGRARGDTVVSSSQPARMENRGVVPVPIAMALGIAVLVAVGGMFYLLTSKSSMTRISLL